MQASCCFPIPSDFVSGQRIHWRTGFCSPVKVNRLTSTHEDASTGKTTSYNHCYTTPQNIDHPSTSSTSSQPIRISITTVITYLFHFTRVALTCFLKRTSRRIPRQFTRNASAWSQIRHHIKSTGARYAALRASSNTWAQQSGEGASG